MRILVTTVVAGLAIAAPLAEGGPAEKSRAPVERSPDLWATVNVCDTPGNPDRIGVRGSMPGVGRRAKLQMRFQVQYVSREDGKWHNIPGDSADTGFVKVGRTRSRVIEAGHTFHFEPPSAGGAHTLRGAVTFRWRRRGRTVERIREITEAGHRPTVADPEGFSAAICRID